MITAVVAVGLHTLPTTAIIVMSIAHRYLQQKNENLSILVSYPLRGLHLLRLVAFWRGGLFLTHHSLTPFFDSISRPKSSKSRTSSTIYHGGVFLSIFVYKGTINILFHKTYNQEE